MQNAVIIIGANSKIAKALIESYQLDQTFDWIVCVSRTLSPTLSSHGDLLWLSSDYSVNSIVDITKHLKELDLDIQRIIICNGFLHNHSKGPEKKIDHFDNEHFERSMQVNAALPMLWLKNLYPLRSKTSELRVAVISARVGSIEDNQLGGWYSYRASKAALNMMLKTFAIETKRHQPTTKIICYHPGTTDTPLSKPFQKNVPPGKLFTTEFSAQALRKVLESDIENNVAYLDWDNQPIPW